MQNSDNLANEWCLLQNQFDSYEKYSLIIKLSAIGLLSTAYFLNNLSVFVLLIILVLWLQDSIWKTFQSRIEIRLLQIEKNISCEEQNNNDKNKAFQFNSLYLLNRPTSIGLIKEYLLQSIRPTVAFPYIVLLLIMGFIQLMS